MRSSEDKAGRRRRRRRRRRMNEKNETSRAQKLTLNLYNMYVCVLDRNRSLFFNKHIKWIKEKKIVLYV